MSRTTVLPKGIQWKEDGEKLTEKDLSTQPSTVNYEDAISHLAEDNLTDVLRNDVFLLADNVREHTIRDDEENNFAFPSEPLEDEVSASDSEAAENEEESFPLNENGELSFTPEDIDDTKLNSDMIRLYFSQMIQAPLLSREEEIVYARRIERSRSAFRRCVLGSPFGLQQAFRMLDKVYHGSLAFERTIRLALSEHLSKNQIRCRMPQNLKTLAAILETTTAGFATLVNKHVSNDHKKLTYRANKHRLRRALVLVEELSLRNRKVHLMLNQIETMSKRMQDIRQLLRDEHIKIAPERRRKLHHELRKLIKTAQEGPEKLRKRCEQARQLLREYEEAKSAMSQSNLRLVVAIAKKYRNRGVPFQDLIQEGNTGLMRAVDKFEYRRGFKFSTYAIWWIRQSVVQAIAEQSRAIRIPLNMIDQIARLRSAARTIYQETGRHPSIEEVAAFTNIKPEAVRKILITGSNPISLEHPIGEEEDNSFGDLLADHKAEMPEQSASNEILQKEIAKTLNTLTYREREVIKLRYGLGGGYTYTLEEIGRIFQVTRERVRQIEQSAVMKLQQPGRNRNLACFLPLCQVEQC